MIVDIVGRRGMGKSTLALYLSRTAEKVIAFDPRNQFPSLGPVYTYTSTDVADLYDFLMAETVTRIVVRPGGDLQAASELLARDVRELLTLHPELKLTVILDEAGTLDLRPWNWLFRTCDRERVWFVLTCHRPVDVDTTVRALVDYWCVFRMVQPNDLRVLEERCGAAFADACRSLGPREWLLWDDTTSDERVQIRAHRDPAVWHVALDRPTVIATPTSLPAGDAFATRGGLF